MSFGKASKLQSNFREDRRMSTDHKKVKEITHQIADLMKRWPAHSTPPVLMQQLDELEVELEKALSRNEGVDKNHNGSETHT